MREAPYIALISLAVMLGGVLIGYMTGIDGAEKRMATAICKKLESKFAKLDGDPVCLLPTGGVIRFFE